MQTDIEMIQRKRKEKIITAQSTPVPQSMKQDLVAMSEELEVHEITRDFWAKLIAEWKAKK